MQYELHVVVAGTIAPSSTGTVSSFNGRTGAVTPASGDYTPAKVASLDANEYVAGKNFVINGGMDIWQRGTTFASVYASPTYVADRWSYYTISTANTYTISQIASGLTNFQYAKRIQRTNGSTQTSPIYLAESFETINSLPLANKTVTLSFWARAGANYSPASSSLAAYVWSGTGTDQNILTSYTGLTGVASQSCILTTSWQKFSFIGTVGSTATELAVQFVDNVAGTAGANDYFDITGVQLEIAPQATPFSRAGGSIGGELALCQRYYQRWVSATAYSEFIMGMVDSTTVAIFAGTLSTTMRVAPSVSATNCSIYAGSAFSVGTITPRASANTAGFYCTTSGLTAYRPARLEDSGSNNGYIEFGSEL